MNREQLLDDLAQTFKQGIEIVEKKNQDYAIEDDAFYNFRSSSVIGLPPEKAILVRILDKLARISNLIDKEAAVKDESIDDTLIDTINYLAILKAYLKQK